jgi:hypothetical protein
MDITNLIPNEKIVFDKIQKDGPFTVNSLMDCFNFKLSTLKRIINSLKPSNLIVEVGHEESSGGRKPALYDINIKDAYIIGIDISRPHTRVVLCDMKIRIKGCVEFLEAPAGPEKILLDITDNVASLLHENGLTMADILCIGVGVTGPYDRKSGKILKVDLMDEWNDFPIRSAMERLFSCPIYIDNGAHAAVLGE